MFREFFDQSTGKWVTSEREVKERKARGEVLISPKEAEQEARKNRERNERVAREKARERLDMAVYLLRNGEKNIVERVNDKFRE